MNALIVTPAHALELRDIPVPQPGPMEALVRILACGICSTTDRELIRGTQPYNRNYPAVLGHEAVGRVVDVGAQAVRLKVGDLVTRPAAILPGTSRDGLFSAWGGFAEYGLVRDVQPAHDYTAVRQNVVDPRLSVPQAVLAISLSETASWCWQLGALGGRTVCVAGTGVAGLSIALWCKLAGAQQVIVLGRRDERLAQAAGLAADATVNVVARPAVAAVRACAPGGVDVYCDAVGTRGQWAQAAALLKPGGVMARYAVEPAGGYEPPEALPEGARLVVPEAREHLAYRWVTDLLLRGTVRAESFLTHSWPLAQYAEAFGAVERGRAIKALLTLA